MADIKAKRISDLSPKTDITPDAKLPIIDKTVGGSYDNFSMPVSTLTQLAKGDKGDTGTPGTQGPQGEPGPIPLVKSPDAPSDTDLLWIDTDDDGSMFIGPGTTDYNELINKPDLTLKADKATTYTKTEVDTALTGKANTVHTHTAANITDFDAEVSNNTDVAANTAARHTHANKAVLDATTASFTTADETKLDGIETGAQVNTVTSVNTRTGAVVLDADDISDAATTNKFVTATEKAKLSNLSGTNTGDNLFIGTTPPTPSTGTKVLWLDTTGGNITFNLVTGD